MAGPVCKRQGNRQSQTRTIASRRDAVFMLHLLGRIDCWAVLLFSHVQEGSQRGAGKTLTIGPVASRLQSPQYANWCGKDAASPHESSGQPDSFSLKSCGAGQT